MQIAYRKELEKAAHRMILIHRTDTLIRLIIRTVIKNLKLSHAGIFLYDPLKSCYILTISRGKKGVKIPSGFVKITQSSPLAEYFGKNHNLWDDNFLLVERIRDALRRKSIQENKEQRESLQRLLYQLSIYKSKAALPIIFRDELLGIFILGEKIGRRNFYPEELTFLSILSSDVAMAIRNASLFEDLKLQLERNKALFLQTITALAQAIEAKDKYTKGHTERVARYSLMIAEQLRKIRKIKNPEKFIRSLKIAARLHDIGKIGIPEQILNKTKVLTKRDVAVIQMHPLIGEEILSPIRELEEVVAAVKCHHERYDGGGYPSGIKGKNVPLLASIIAVADAFDAMISDRPYRKAFSRLKAIKLIKENVGIQFHPKVVEAFLRAFQAPNK